MCFLIMYSINRLNVLNCNLSVIIILYYMIRFQDY